MLRKLGHLNKDGVVTMKVRCCSRSIKSAAATGSCLHGGEPAPNSSPLCLACLGRLQTQDGTSVQPLQLSHSLRLAF